MKDKTHKPGIHENYLMTRHLKIEGLDKALIDPLVDQLTSLPEVDDVAITVSRSSTVLNIAYDASICDHPLDDIKQALTMIGASIADDWWTHFKREYYTFTDQNAYDNSRHEPWCCNKVPPGK
jgi:hypothetical protein